MKNSKAHVVLSTQWKRQPSATQTLDVLSHVHQAVKNAQGATHDFQQSQQQPSATQTLDVLSHVHQAGKNAYIAKAILGISLI